MKITTRRTWTDGMGSSNFDVTIDGKVVGEVWSNGPGRWHARYGGTQLTRGWRFAPTKADAVQRVVDEHYSYRRWEEGQGGRVQEGD
jgi:hypothetical protein